MGTYHKNLTDRAVLSRLTIAAKNPTGILNFNVPKAKKSFTITIYKDTPDSVLVHKAGSIIFSLVEKKEE